MGEKLKFVNKPSAWVLINLGGLIIMWWALYFIFINDGHYSFSVSSIISILLRGFWLALIHSLFFSANKAISKKFFLSSSFGYVLAGFVAETIREINRFGDVHGCSLYDKCGIPDNLIAVFFGGLLAGAIIGVSQWVGGKDYLSKNWIYMNMSGFSLGTVVFLWLRVGMLDEVTKPPYPRVLDYFIVFLLASMFPVIFTGWSLFEESGGFQVKKNK